MTDRFADAIEAEHIRRHPPCRGQIAGKDEDLRQAVLILLEVG